MRFRRRIGSRLALVVVCVVVAGCAVDTPRDGFTTAGGRAGTGSSGVAAGPGGGTDDGGTTADDPLSGSSGEATGSGPAGDATSDPGQAAGGSGAAAGGGASSGGDDSSGVTAAPGGSGGAATEARRASDVGVTRDTITISFSGQFSGVLGAGYEKGYRNGILGWVEDINARGGINGRRVVMKRIDNGGSAEGAIAACRQATSNGSFAVLMGAALDAEPSCVDEAGVPGIALLSSSLQQPWKMMKAVQATPGAGKALAHFIKGGLKAGGKKVGVVYSNEASFKACADFLKSTAQQLGIDVVAMQPVQPDQASFVSEVSRLRSAGVEVVAAIVTVEILGLLRDAQAIGYRPTWTGVPWPLDEISAAARAQMEGIKGLRVGATADSSAHRAFEALAARQGKPAPSSTDSNFYGYALMLEHYLRKAGVNPTRKSFVAALESGDPHSNGLNPEVRWGPGKFLGSNGWFPAVCCDNQNRWKSLGPASETFGT